MKYQVHVTDPAHADIEAAYQWLAERTEHAADWFNGLADVVEGLSSLPTRCPAAPESRHFREKIHQILYGRRPHFYRVLFIVRSRHVFVLHVRHGAREAMEPADVRFPH